MASEAHLRRDHGTPTSTEPYIDWGPDLPGRYDGGRARVLVANPRALFVTWETATPPAGWRLDVVIGGEREQTIELGGDASETWVSVRPRLEGEVRLFREGERVATLPFETPPDAPSDDTSERWARVDERGQVHAASSIGGTALGPEAIARPDGVGSSVDLSRGG